MDAEFVARPMNAGKRPHVADNHYALVKQTLTTGQAVKIPLNGAKVLSIRMGLYQRSHRDPDHPLVRSIFHDGDDFLIAWAEPR